MALNLSDFATLGLDSYMNFLPETDKTFKINMTDPNPHVRSIERFMEAIVREESGDLDKCIIFYKELDDAWKAYFLEDGGKVFKIISLKENMSPFYVFPQIISDFGRNMVGILEEVEPDTWRIVH